MTNIFGEGNLIRQGLILTACHQKYFRGRSKLGWWGWEEIVETAIKQDKPI